MDVNAKTEKLEQERFEAESKGRDPVPRMGRVFSVQRCVIEVTCDDGEKRILRVPPSRRDDVQKALAGRRVTGARLTWMEVAGYMVGVVDRGNG